MITFVNGNTSSKEEPMPLDLAEMEKRVLACLPLAETPASPDVRIQTSEMLPETDVDGNLLFLDGQAMRENGFMDIWGDLLCHPNTLERFKEHLDNGKTKPAV